MPIGELDEVLVLVDGVLGPATAVQELRQVEARLLVGRLEDQELLESSDGQLGLPVHVHLGLALEPHGRRELELGLEVQLSAEDVVRPGLTEDVDDHRVRGEAGQQVLVDLEGCLVLVVPVERPGVLALGKGVGSVLGDHALVLGDGLLIPTAADEGTGKSEAGPGVLRVALEDAREGPQGVRIRAGLEGHVLSLSEQHHGCHIVRLPPQDPLEVGDGPLVVLVVQCQLAELDAQPDVLTRGAHGR